MKIIKPSWEIWERDGQRGNLAVIERAGRVCYKSEARIGEGSAEGFVRGLVERGHLGMLEHGDYVFEVGDWHIFETITTGLAVLEREYGRAPMIAATHLDGHMLVSGNCRAWRELVQLHQDFVAGAGIAGYFIPYIDRAYIGDICDVSDYGRDFRIRPVDAARLESPLNERIHLRQTIKFVIDRGVSHEFVRHRVMSFAQESTRWCNYSQDKFGGEITVIEPSGMDRGAAKLWRELCQFAEGTYLQMLETGLKPELARAALPTSTKTELVMTGTLGDWQHFFDLRALEKTGRAHPQAREVARPLMWEMAKRFPGAIETK